MFYSILQEIAIAISKNLLLNKGIVTYSKVTTLTET